MSYEITSGHYTAKQTANDMIVLANFKAEIVRQTTVVVDEDTKIVQFAIVGEGPSGKLPEVIVDAKKYGTMSWVDENWGAGAVIFPEPNAVAEMKTAIKILSQNIEFETIYQHTGWIKIGGEWKYLHCGGAIGKDGNDKSVKVSLPKDLRFYELPTLTDDDLAQAKEDWNASMSLLRLAGADKIAPVLAATWRACITQSDFAVHLTGRSGSFKSEVTSLMQSHYGKEMDARHLPGSWSSTANSIEALAYRAKDAVFVIDDFIPVGTSWQVRQLQANADRVIRALGNQQGRARLTDVSSLQETMFPRGLVISSGEDTPEGQSLRGRMIIMELSKGDVDVKELTAAQAKRDALPRAMSGFIQWLARGRDAKTESFEQMRIENRDVYQGHGHTRTPTMAADLHSAAYMWLQYGMANAWITQEDSDKYEMEFHAAIKAACIDQTRFITESDPAEAFVKVLQTGFMAGRFHLRDVTGARPDNPSMFGWIEDTSGQTYSYKPKGTLIGWVDEQKGNVYLDSAMGYEEVRRCSAGAITVTASTLWKRLKEAGIINAIDEKRSRNTVRLTVKGVQKTVASIALDRIVTVVEDDEQDGPQF